jgi:hypothetical protein
MWEEAQRIERERLWPAVEQLLSGLPPSVSGQFKLLEYDLALRYSSTGQFRDIFLGADQFPLLSMAGWLIEDFSLLTAPKRDRAERHLFRAAVLMAARTHVIRSVIDEASFYDAEHVALIQLLSERVIGELARLVRPRSRAWGGLEAIAVDALEGLLVNQRVRRAPLQLDGPDAYLGPRWFTPARMLALATLTTGQRLEDAPGVNALLDEVASAFEIKSELLSMHADLMAGRPTYPIALVARAAGIALEPWPDAAVILGALVATNSADAIIDAAIARLREGRRQAKDLGLVTFVQYLEDVEAGLEERRPRPAPLSSDGRVERQRSPASAPMIELAQPSFSKAIEMAEGFLVADPTFRESWESHREGMFGSPLVASRFPAGLILEMLSARGLDVSEHIDAFLAFTEDNHFRYYDHPWSHVDLDTLGIYLRLVPHAASADRGEAANSVLACLERDVASMGRVPVWITNCEGSPSERPYMLDLGEGCGTVAAHLLLGLLTYAPDRYAATIERGSVQLLEQIEAVGMRANVNYPPVFALAVFGRLLASLEDAKQGFLGGQTKRAARNAHRVLVAALGRTIERNVLTPQQAALLTIACLRTHRSEQLDPRWRSTILKGQRFDGSWIGEPFAAAPNRGLAVTWYSSSLLTSALCYDALMAFA